MLMRDTEPLEGIGKGHLGRIVMGEVESGR